MLKLAGIPRTLTFLFPVSSLTAKPFPLSLRLQKLHSSPLSPSPLASSTDDAVSASVSVSVSVSARRPPPHPWPEWVDFVDGLKSKGYISESLREEDAGGDGEGGEGEGEVYRDMKIMKDACLRFARDRYDIFKSLSTDDIQGVVKNGCPNVLRKAVNSAKRLRAYVRLDEADVCSACILRGSCDRAYLIFNESEAVAGTVDIMRVLLFYALDPMVISGREKAPLRGETESCTRRLLHEMVELSESTFDAVQLPMLSVVKAPSSQTEKRVKEPDRKLSHDPDMKRGDWMCPECNFLNFSKNIQCLKCKEDGPRKVGLHDIGPKKGDWMCPECNFMNFSRNTQCLNCKAEGPEKIAMHDIEMKKGDWNCPQCKFMNFARNTQCVKCSEPRPPRNLKPGDWECTLCDFWNYSRNVVCRECGAKRPSEVSVAYKDQVWKKPQAPAA